MDDDDKGVENEVNEDEEYDSDSEATYSSKAWKYLRWLTILGCVVFR